MVQWCAHALDDGAAGNTVEQRSARLGTCHAACTSWCSVVLGLSVHSSLCIRCEVVSQVLDDA